MVGRYKGLLPSTTDEVIARNPMDQVAQTPSHIRLSEVFRAIAHSFNINSKLYLLSFSHSSSVIVFPYNPAFRSPPNPPLRAFTRISAHSSWESRRAGKLAVLWRWRLPRSRHSAGIKARCRILKCKLPLGCHGLRWRSEFAGW